MRVWIDLSNSPHVQIFRPVVRRLQDQGHEISVTARDHAQTVELAQRHWPDVLVIGEPSPSPLMAKGYAVLGRAAALRRLAVRERFDVALSHGSYAQIIAARAAGIPCVTMMDYEYQPANHLSFRLARRILVPWVFPEKTLKRSGASARKVVRYWGFKEELYLAGFKPDPAVLHELGLDPGHVIAVLRPPPEGALYHRSGNERFGELLRLALDYEGVQVVLLPRTHEQGKRYRALSDRIRIPEHAIDGCSLLALADLTVGAGGTMNRESAILGTPTYTLFAGQLAAVDAELIRSGRLVDIRPAGGRPRFEKKTATPTRESSPANAEPIVAAILEALDSAAR